MMHYFKILILHKVIYLQLSVLTLTLKYFEIVSNKMINKLQYIHDKI